MTESTATEEFFFCFHENGPTLLPDKTWQTNFELGMMDTHGRAVWRNGILGNRLTRAATRKNDVKR